MLGLRADTILLQRNHLHRDSPGPIVTSMGYTGAAAANGSIPVTAERRTAATEISMASVGMTALIFMAASMIMTTSRIPLRSASLHRRRTRLFKRVYRIRLPHTCSLEPPQTISATQRTSEALSRSIRSTTNCSTLDVLTSRWRSKSEGLSESVGKSDAEVNVRADMYPRTQIEHRLWRGATTHYVRPNVLYFTMTTSLL